jgi:hypothetical protein
MFVLVVAPQTTRDSQILLAYQSKLAFIGELVYIGHPPKLFSTATPVGIQTVVLRVKRIIRGSYMVPFIRVGLEIPVNDKYGPSHKYNEGDEYIVFLGDGDCSSWCEDQEWDANLKKWVVPTKFESYRKSACFVSTMRSIIDANDEEVAAIEKLLKN